MQNVDKALFSLRSAPIEQALAAWHATPLERDEALAALALRRPAHGPRAELERTVLRYWATGELLATTDEHLATGTAITALSALVRGELLLSRRLEGAFAHLDRGFALAAPLLTPRDYLDVLKRHRRLRWLVLGHVPAPAMDLPELLSQADVTRALRAAAGEDPRFEPGAATRRGGDHGDTVG